MSTVAAGFRSFVPGVSVAPVADREREKYRRMWTFDAYRKTAPGEFAARHFLHQVHPNPGDTVIDFGAGTGRGALILALFGKMNVTMVDFADNCLDEDVRNALITQPHALRFVEADLRKPIPVAAKYGYCTDVMEHIPPADVDAALDNILKSAEHVFFQISLVDDAMGALIDEPLHLSVHPFDWWKQKLVEHEAVITWSRDDGDSAMFYATAWNSANELVARGAVNTGLDEIDAHIRSAVARDLEQLRPYDRQDATVMLLGGGPSLAEYEDEIIARRKAGELLITTNGTYNWCIDRGINPSAQIVVDAREFNKRFVEPPIENCRYMIASQCHPAVFDAAPPRQVLLWHAGLNDAQCDMLDQLYAERMRKESWYPVPGGSTVMLRAFTLLRILGFAKFDVYGFDSCLKDGAHHSYAQVENEGDRVIQVSSGGRVFSCTAWMASQAQEFIDLMRLLGDEVQMNVHGDGLIAHIIKTAAEDLSTE